MAVHKLSYDEKQDTAQPDPIVVAVRQYQQNYQLWLKADEPEVRECLRQAQQIALEQLWTLLEQDLLGIAHGWCRSAIRQNNDAPSFAFNLFYYIIEALPNLSIDPTRNPRNYLLKIVRNGIYDENGKIYRKTLGPRRVSSDQGVTSGTEEAAMWDTGVPFILSELVDPQGAEQEEAVINAIFAEECLPHIRDFWNSQLCATDRAILWMRIGKTPPIKYDDIACALGPGWEAATVRQRYRRCVKKIRQHLEKQGLLIGSERL